MAKMQHFKTPGGEIIGGGLLRACKLPATPGAFSPCARMISQLPSGLAGSIPLISMLKK